MAFGLRLIYPVVFAVTIFLTSGLLFFIQPLVGKMLMPRFGGTPLVWNTTIVFFLAAVLAGYLLVYVLHWTGSRAVPAIIHLVLLALGFGFLFTGGNVASVDLEPGAYPIWQTLMILGAGLGLPVMVIAATGPMVQSWFAETAHPDRADPYFLNAASNMGGLFALALYPTWIEPHWALSQQYWAWQAAFFMLILLSAGCVGFLLLPRNRPEPTPLVLEPVPSILGALAPAAPSRPTLGRRLRWLLCAAVPVSMLMGLTTALTTDIAPAPLFWVVPLALYLFTYILAFTRFSPWRRTPLGVRIVTQVLHVLLLFGMTGATIVLARHSPELGMFAGGLCLVLALLVPYAWVWVLQPLATVAYLVSLAVPDQASPAVIALNLLAFFFSARIAHRELFRARPTTEYLPEYYVWIGVGGLLGGLFHLALAPLMFPTGLYEYPFAMALACVLRPPYLRNGLSDWLLCQMIESGQSEQPQRGLRAPLAVCFDIGVALVVALPLWLILGELRDAARGQVHTPALVGVYLLAGIVCLVTVARPLRFGLCLCLFVLLHTLFAVHRDTQLVALRSPLGTLRVTLQVEQVAGVNHEHADLIQGHINQGTNFRAADLQRLATTYYHRHGPLGIALEKFNWFPGPPNTYWADARGIASLVGLGAVSRTSIIPLGQMSMPLTEPPIAIVGLGTGTIASYARPFQRMDFFELNPQVIQLSEPPAAPFKYVEDARRRGAHVNLIPGDGRLGLARHGPDQYYQVIVIDAFSSDAIPTHLLTREALQLYLKKLAPRGLLCIHTSNRFVDLPPMLADLAKDLGLAYRRGHDQAPDKELGHFTSEWLMLAGAPRDLDHLREPPKAAANAKQPPPWQQGDAKFWSEPPPPGRRVWTDEHAPLNQVLRDPWLPNLLSVVLLGLLGSVLLISFAGAFFGVAEAAAPTTRRTTPVKAYPSDEPPPLSRQRPSTGIAPHE